MLSRSANAGPSRSGGRGGADTDADVDFPREGHVEVEVTALHSHMIDDSPHLFFMHFWANDDSAKLAQGLQAALDRANVKRGS